MLLGWSNWGWDGRGM